MEHIDAATLQTYLAMKGEIMEAAARMMADTGCSIDEAWAILKINALTTNMPQLILLFDVWAKEYKEKSNGSS